MPSQLPLELLLAWIAFFVSAVGQFHHEQIIRREFGPARLLRAVEISQLLWLVAALAVLVYYFVAAHWYWPLALAVGGSMIGALVAGLLFGVLGEKLVSTVGFAIWPSAAAYAIFIIHGLPS